MPESIIYYREKLSSFKTEVLFLALMLLFCLSSAWRVITAGMDALAVLFTFLAILFLFYSLNFRTLEILIVPEFLKLTFGIFKWKVPVEYIADCRLDELPVMMKYGGAGIHFMLIRKRYRVSFNFLEYPRVVVALRQKAGPVCDISFSTRQPEQVLQLLQGILVAAKTTIENG